MPQVNHATLKRCSCPDHEGPNPLPVGMFSSTMKRGRPSLYSRCKACRARDGREKRRSGSPANAEKVKSCLICGGPTTTSLGICRRSRACDNEYNRRMRQEYPERRNVYVRRYRQSSRVPGASYVYGIWFPAVQVLKVGFTGHASNSPFVSSARTRAERRGWETAGSACIWKQSGDVRTEAWIQATVAFRWAPAFEQKQGRICEWFAIPGLTVPGVIEVLDEVYGLVPADTSRA